MLESSSTVIVTEETPAADIQPVDEAQLIAVVEQVTVGAAWLAEILVTKVVVVLGVERLPNVHSCRTRLYVVVAPEIGLTM